MDQVEMCTRVSATLEGFVYGLRLADPNAGFGSSEVFDSAFWSIFSLLEGNAQKALMADSLRKRLDILLDSLYLSAETRSVLQEFRDCGVVAGGCTTGGGESLPRALAVALCETSTERRVERAAEIVAVTHLAPDVVQASIALAEYFASLLVGATAAESAARTLVVVDHPEVAAALRVVPSVDLADIVGGVRLGPAHPVEVVRCVAWVVQQNVDPDVLLRQVIEQSNADPALASLSAAALGASGAKFGYEACPDLRSEEIALQILDCRHRCLAT